MPHFLQLVLDAQEPLFSSGLSKLEKTTGYSGVDVLLIADIIEKAHIIMRKLGLDTRDTTGHELYFALKSAIRRGEGESLLVGADHVLFIENNRIISFNLIDVIENAHHELPFDHQTVSHGQRSLHKELIRRYLDHARTDDITTHEIAGSMGLKHDNGLCYNDGQYYKKQTRKHPKELAE